MKKLTAKQNNFIANGLMFAGVAYDLWDMMQNGMALRWTPVLISVALVTVGALYGAFFVKCPHCGDKLRGLKNKLPECCPNCGGRLDQLPTE